VRAWRSKIDSLVNNRINRRLTTLRAVESTGRSRSGHVGLLASVAPHLKARPVRFPETTTPFLRAWPPGLAVCPPLFVTVVSSSNLVGRRRPAKLGFSASVRASN
jgi:hypothetical protein